METSCIPTIKSGEAGVGGVGEGGGGRRGFRHALELSLHFNNQERRGQAGGRGEQWTEGSEGSPEFRYGQTPWVFTDAAASSLAGGGRYTHIHACM